MPRVDTDYQLVSPEYVSLESILPSLEEASVISVDVETEGFDHRRDRVVGWAISVREHQAWYIPVRHHSGSQYEPEQVADALRPFIEDRSKKIICFNAKFENRFLETEGIEMDQSHVEDPGLQVYVAGDEKHQKFGLKEIVKREFNILMTEFNDLFPKGTKVKNIATVPFLTVCSYACADADMELRLHNLYYGKVKEKFVYKLESRLWPVVRRIEDRGAKLDRDFLVATSAYLRDEADKVKEIIYDQVEAVVGRRIEFNIASFVSLGEVLYRDMKMPVVAKTPAGKPATDELALERLAERFPVCHNILMYRSILSTATSLGKTLLDNINPVTGRIHTSYIQTGAVSGRFASQNPNLQNVGKIKKWSIIQKDGSTYEIVVLPRSAFIAEKGYYLIELDFKAIEFIIFAAIAGETAVVKAYEDGLDVHKQTASDMLHIPYDTVTKEQRDKHKTFNYLVIYGGGSSGLSMRSSMSEEESKEAIERFYQVRPFFADFIKKTRKAAKKSKKVVTFFGRPAVVFDYYEDSRKALSKADRACVNLIVQGSAADFQKIGLVNTDKMGRQEWTEEQARTILQTHDSQTWEVRRDISPDVAVKLIAEAMSSRVKDLPRIQVDAKIGISWGVMKDYEEGMDYQSILDKLDADRAAFVMPISQPVVKPAAEIASESGETASIRLMFYPGRKIVASDIKTLTESLASFPGLNVVVCVSSDNTQTPLKKYPTSLSADTLRQLLLPYFPECKITSSKESVYAAVVAGVFSSSAGVVSDIPLSSGLL